MLLSFQQILLKGSARCTFKRILFPSIMPKRTLQKPAEKKLKPNLSSIEMSNDQEISNNINLNESTLSTENIQENNEKHKMKLEYLNSPIKSENDKKEYRVIKLENGLTALLIADLHSTKYPSHNIDGIQADAISSETEDDETDDDDEEDEDEDEDESEDEDDESGEDEEGKGECERLEGDDGHSLGAKRLKREEKMAACGLCVGVGSFSDPPEIPGMAHFLEHMVFMGSEKYPQENDFDAFITKRSGSDNASTECEQTTFYFEVQEKYLLASLDRFAQFFIKPLMKQGAIAREREAVESEFQMALPSDLYRKEQLFCSFARPNHPARKFTWGNLITLRDNVTDDKLYEELHKFRKRHYSAHRMKLAIQAKLPLDTLEEYVLQCFSEVPNNGLPPSDFNQFKGADSFDTPSFRKIYKVKPIKDVCQIELTWAMPPLHDLYKSKPHHYIAWIIGHEGIGSLISYLRKKMWCLDIFSGNGESGFEHCSMYALFSLSLILTEEGHKHLEDVLNSIFSYINLMRKEGPQKRIYDEIAQIEETNFRFMDEVAPADYVEELSENMHFFPPEDYITGSELYFDYNPEAIQMCMDYLSPDNVNIIIFDKKFNDEEFDKVEPWFKTKYTDMDIPTEWTETWKTITPLPEFHLPLPNIFLTNDFSLIPVISDVPKYPVKIHSDDISEIWYRPDPKFGLPECYMYFYIISPLTTSAKNVALMDLFIEILKQLLVEELYPATAAELKHQMYTGQKGIVVKVSGFNEKLSLLLNICAKYIANSPNLITKDLFDIMKQEQLKAYYNTFVKPAKLAKDVRLSILMLDHWPAVDRHTAISGTTFNEFQTFIEQFTKHTYIQCLVQGNMTKENVIKNIQNCIDILKCGPLLSNTMPQLRVTKLPTGIQYCKVQNFNKMDVNSVVTNYYQSGISSIKLTVIIELLLMIMEEPLFNQLRTQEQLGYDVSCLMRNTYGILGYSITVYTQADKHSTEHVDNRIEKFLKSFNKLLKETSEKDLETIKEALTKIKQCADIHLKEEVDRNWFEITNCDYVFDRLEKEIIAIDSIKIEELRNWIASHTINGDNLKKLSVHIIGNKEQTLDEKKDMSKLESDNKITYKLNYLNNKVTKANKSSEVYITDIDNFKSDLPIYPLKDTLG
ncbi:nardilysin-like [Vespa velutina]|uniref:nardilysin-like n=1 Tax=Vespa velutina TaxID=202808 RepID=UPI001FB39DAD|nr:nardilysin-like [Vespa velutina]